MLEKLHYLLMCVASAIRMISYDDAEHAINYCLVVIQNLGCDTCGEKAICQNGVDADAPQVQSFGPINATVCQPRFESVKCRPARSFSMLPSELFEGVIGHDNSKVFGM